MLTAFSNMFANLWQRRCNIRLLGESFAVSLFWGNPFFNTKPQPEVIYETRWLVFFYENEYQLILFKKTSCFTQKHINQSAELTVHYSWRLYACIIRQTPLSDGVESETTRTYSWYGLAPQAFVVTVASLTIWVLPTSRHSATGVCNF